MSDSFYKEYLKEKQISDARWDEILRLRRDIEEKERQISELERWLNLWKDQAESLAKIIKAKEEQS